MTKQRIYGLTAVSAILYILLNWIFADGYFKVTGGALFSQKDPKDGITVISNGTIWTYVLLALIILVGLYQASRIPESGVELDEQIDEQTPGQIHDPRGWRLLLGNVLFSIVWMPLRFYVGRDWLAAGEHKLRSDAWMNGGSALKGFWTGATTIPEGGTASKAQGTVGWFHDFLVYMLNHEWYTWFAKLIAIGEFLVGLGILVGALVGIAAFFGTLMNFNFELAGTTSVNPVLFGLGVFLVLAWKVAGYWGLDRWLLPALGTPWMPGRILTGAPRPAQRQAPGSRTA
jgi:thiosulfate dehydrogenase [quinone] large subunit